MLFSAVRSQEFVSLTVGLRWGLMDKMLMASSFSIQGGGCEGIREEVTCDAGSLEAVTWQPVGGAVYMQNAAINSVKCLPEPCQTGLSGGCQVDSRAPGHPGAGNEGNMKNKICNQK